MVLLLVAQEQLMFQIQILLVQDLQIQQVLVIHIYHQFHLLEQEQLMDQMDLIMVWLLLQTEVYLPVGIQAVLMELLVKQWKKL